MSDEFLDDIANLSNENSTICIDGMKVVFDSQHPTLPHAVALCIESGNLIVVGRSGLEMGIAYYKKIPTDAKEMLIRERRITFKNSAYVRDVLKIRGSYKKETQLPVSVYSNEAQITGLHFLKEQEQNSFLYSISVARKLVKMTLANGDSLDVTSPMLSGEILIELEIDSSKARRVTYSASEILIDDQRASFREIDYALLATMSRVEW